MGLQATVEPLTDDQIDSLLIAYRMLECYPSQRQGHDFARALLALAAPPTSKATALPDAEEVTLQHLSIGKANCAPACKYFGSEGCECALPSTSKADTGEAIRNAALEEAAEAIWQFRSGETISPSLMQNISLICALVRALKSATTSAIKAEPTGEQS
jgi:hypothetical protein